MVAVPGCSTSARSVAAVLTWTLTALNAMGRAPPARVLSCPNLAEGLSLSLTSGDAHAPRAGGSHRLSQSLRYCSSRVRLPEPPPSAPQQLRCVARTTHSV